MIAGIILAAGKGKRFGDKSKNKSVALLKGKPLVAYAVETLQGVVHDIWVVVGYQAGSVRSALNKYKVTYVVEEEQLGTGHAVRVCVDFFKENNINPEHVLIGYGDHMMFYPQKTIQTLISQHIDSNSSLTLIASSHDSVDDFGFGRIIRDEKGNFVETVEQRDATAEQRRIKEFNAGVYMMKYSFVEKYIHKLSLSPLSQEYYLTELITMAMNNGEKVSTITVPFEEVGVGINTGNDLNIAHQFMSSSQGL